MSYEEPLCWQQQSLIERLHNELPLHTQHKDVQQFELARYGLKAPLQRLTHFRAALTDSHWVEMLHAYQAGDLAEIGYIFDRAIRAPQMMERVDRDCES